MHLHRYLRALGAVRGLVVLTGAAVVTGLIVPTPAMADMDPIGAMARGGHLYDNWAKTLKMDAPEDTHPSWPSDSKKKGKTTWRCKSCHGWDYKGAEGAYGKGSFKTGIKGIAGAAGKDPSAIVAIMKDDTHAYGGKIDDADLAHLAAFVSGGQVDMTQYIDPGTLAPKGDAAKGAGYYNTICAGCHGEDGLKPKEMKPFGEQMAKDPWEVLHKILNGQAGEDEMPGLRALDTQIAVDIMAHMVSLPKER